MNNVSLSCNSFTEVIINPPLEQAKELKNFFETLPISELHELINQNSQNRPSNPYDAKRLTIEELKKLEPNVKQYYALRCHLDSFMLSGDLKEAWFIACANPKCGKKIDKNDEEEYVCKHCNASESEKFVFKYNLSLNVMDESGTLRVTIFNAAQKLFGQTAEQLSQYRFVKGNPAYEELLQSVKHDNLVLLLAATMDSTKSPPTPKFIVEDICPVDFIKERNLLYLDIDI